MRELKDEELDLISGGDAVDMQQLAAEIEKLSLGSLHSQIRDQLAKTSRELELSVIQSIKSGS